MALGTLGAGLVLQAAPVPRFGVWRRVGLGHNELGDRLVHFASGA